MIFPILTEIVYIPKSAAVVVLEVAVALIIVPIVVARRFEKLLLSIG